jgi:polyisoprenoid-binding protein YceI
MKYLVALAVSVVLAGSAAAKTFELDPQHSSVSFKIRHLVTKVSGRFEKFSGTVEYEKGKPQSWKANAEIDAASINTNVSPRDKHLRSADFFDVDKCPKLAFKTTSVTDVKGDSAKLHGDLTMHCVTKPVILDLQVGGEAKDPWGNERLGASATGKISRKEWGLSWNKALEAGGALVGDEVELDIEIEAGPQQPKEKAK